MVQKRKSKSKPKKVRAAKKKASVVKRLKVKARASKVQAKKPLKAAKPVVAAKKGAPAKPAPAAAEKGKAAPKTPIKSAKQALELLEAKVAEVKSKGKPGRAGGRERWLADEHHAARPVAQARGRAARRRPL